MERLNNRAQWIVLMGLLVSIALIFLAIVINESLSSDKRLQKVSWIFRKRILRMYEVKSSNGMIITS